MCAPGWRPARPIDIIQVRWVDCSGCEGVGWEGCACEPWLASFAPLCVIQVLVGKWWGAAQHVL